MRDIGFTTLRRRFVRLTCPATALAVALATPLPALAQEEPPQDSIALPAIRVDAVRAVSTAGSGSVLELNPRTAELAAAPSLEMVLRSMPTVTVRTNSRGEAQFSLRGSGSDARQVAVLLDGVPLSIGFDHRTDLSVLPAGAVSRVTLLKGAPSLLHGPNVLGGVVMLNIAEDDVASAAAAEASLDHTGAYSAAARVSSEFPAGRGLLSIRGGGGYRSRSGVPLPRAVADGQDDLRTNTDLQQADAFAAVRYDGDDGAAISLTLTGSTAERGIAPELHTDSPRFWRYPEMKRGVAAVTAASGDRTSPLGGTWRGALTAGFDAAVTAIESYTDGTFSTVGSREEAHDRTRSLRLSADHSLGGRATMRVAGTAADVRRSEDVDGRDAEYLQRLWSLAAEASSAYHSGIAALPDLRLSLTAALDGADTPLSGGRPRVAGRTRHGLRGGVALTNREGTFDVHGAVSRRSRFPSLRELYSGALGRFEPNPGLRPETLTAAEAGVTAHASRYELQAVAFHRRLVDAIEQIVLDGGRRQRVNIGNLHSTGFELLAAARVHPVDVAFDVTLQRVAERGAIATPHPDYQPAVSGGVHARVQLPAAVAVRAQTHFAGAQYCNVEGGEHRLAPHVRHDVGVTRALRTRRGHIEAVLDMENALDTAIYDQCGLPQPGRTLRFHLRLRT
jgi:iron complex outermembrane recepter protein